jgi:hypothetical protein
MKKHRTLVEQCEKLGFVLLPKQKINSGDGAYFLHAESADMGIEKYLNVRYLYSMLNPRYALRFGFMSSKLRSFFKDAQLLPLPLVEAINCLQQKNPYCWFTQSIRFASSRLMTWGLPYESNELTQVFSGKVAEFLGLEVLPIVSESDLLRLYLKEDAPFEWFLSTSSFARMCEIAYLVASTKANPEVARKVIEANYLRMTKADSYGARLPIELLLELPVCIESNLALSGDHSI